MDIAFCINDAYADFICVTIKSIIDSNPNRKIRFHILTDRLSDKSRKHLVSNCNLGGAEIKIYLIDDNSLRNLKLSKFTIYAWYRILLPATLPNDLERVLYLDADTIVTGSLDTLFDTDLTGKAIAAVPDDDFLDKDPYQRCDMTDGSSYICSGVMLINLTFWRNHDITSKIIEWGLQNSERLLYPDQDAINHVCQNDTVCLELKYGVTERMIMSEGARELMYGEIMDACHDPIIVHFNRIAPWYYECSHPFAKFWHDINNTLRSFKIKQRYKNQSKGINRLKSKVWRMLHPHHYKKQMISNWQRFVNSI